MVSNGLDILLRDTAPLRNRRIALIANQTSVTRDLTYSWQELQRRGVVLKRIFSPEHGLFSTEQDQVAVKREPLVGTEVISLYGSDPDSLVPESQLLEDIDLVIFDIQDIGTRYYTYSNTLALFMKTVNGRDIEIMVLDRPNPLGGKVTEGPMPDHAFRSFVGILPVPPRHGLTAGELALLYRDAMKLDVNLRVIGMEGWERSMLFPETGLPWIVPSPNMPSWEAALTYPGTCLFEGLNVSEGRGTTTPFLHMGAPFVEPDILASELTLLGLDGILFRPTYFKPSFSKYCSEIAGAVFLHVTDPERFLPFATGIAVTALLQKLYPDSLRFLHDVYEFNDRYPAFDLLCGSDSLRTMILNETPVTELCQSWTNDELSFSTIKQDYHLYR